LTAKLLPKYDSIRNASRAHGALGGQQSVRVEFCAPAFKVQIHERKIQMKSIISFVVVISFMASAIAQEESPSPSVEEKASATVEESPAASPTEHATAAPTESAAPQKKEAPAVTTPKKEASPAAAKAPTKKMSVEATLKDNESRWEASYAAHDVSVAQSFVANDFVEVYWDGKIMGKSGMISEMKKDKDTYKSAVNEKLAVHTYGPGVAVVVGTAREKGTGKDGKAFDRTFRYTDTWMERNGQWQCVASQVMKLKG
jgi:ketosteroid isomerase-like protein